MTVPIPQELRDAYLRLIGKPFEGLPSTLQTRQWHHGISKFNLLTTEVRRGAAPGAYRQGPNAVLDVAMTRHESSSDRRSNAAACGAVG
jgi:hypothetical protein